MSPAFLRFVVCGVALFLAGGAVAREGVVRTTAGATVRGAVEFTPAGIRVTPAGADAVQVALEQLVEATLGEASPPAGAPAVVPGTNAVTAVPAPATAASGAGVAGAWATHPIGPAANGKLELAGEEWVVTASGSGLHSGTDNFVLVDRRMEVSGQLVGALSAFASTNAEAMAGLVMRDNLGESAAYAFVGQRADSGICFQYRQIASGMTMRITNAAIALPAWLRLSRMGGSVVAEVSSDGRQWQVFGRANVNLGQNIRAGVAVASGVEGRPVTARFREPTVGAAGMGYAPATGYPRVYLRGGSVLMAPVESADASVLRLGGSFSGGMVSLLNVSRVEFLPPSPELQVRLDPERPGLVLADGDFLDGTVRSISSNVVTMSSLLFGFRRFSAGSEAAVIELGPVEPEDTAFRIQLRNGSDLRARTVELGAGTIRAESPLLGALVVRAEDILTLRRAGLER